MTAPPLYDGEVPAAGSPFFASPLATHDTQVESMQMQRRMHDNAVHETPRFHATPVTQLSNQRSSPMPRRLSLSEESPPAPPGFRCASPYERISSPTTDGAVLPTLSSMLHQNWSPQPWPRQSTAGASPTVPPQRLPPTHRSLSISANSIQGPTSLPWHAGTTVKAESLSFHGYSPINTPRSEVTDSQMELSPRERSGSISAYSYTSVSAQEESSFDEVASTPGSPPASGAKKSSRYLREMDRRAILERLARGEKQATLAKEYKVSRAAICNLFKHRDEVMARTDEDPFAKHPKKRKNKKTLKSRRSRSLRLATAPNVHGGDGRTLVTPPSATSTVIQVLSDSVLLLLTAMSDRRSSAKDFRRASERVLWLLIEEALSSVPIKLTQVTMDTDSKIMGVATEHPPCAISMEQHSSPMLEVFQLLESDRPFGQIRILDAVTNACSLVDTHLPATLKYHNVFLFDVAVVSSDTACAMIECAKARGALEVMIYVVALFISADVVETLQDKFPHVRVVTTQIESNILEAQKNRRSCVDVVLGRFDQVYRTQYTLV